MERKEVEAVAERAHKEEQRRLQEEAEVRIEQERREKEKEEEARCRQSRQESTLTPVAALETELPRSKGKGPELAPESEGVQELRTCDSCKRRNTVCVRIKVGGIILENFQLLTAL